MVNPFRATDPGAPVGQAAPGVAVAAPAGPQGLALTPPIAENRMSLRDAEMTRRRRVRQDVEEALIRLDIASLVDGGYLATSPDVPGLVAEGRTLAETSEIAQDVARKILESCVEHGDPLPPAFRKRRPGSKALTIAVGLPAQR